jgi:hypothetical protein
MISRERSSVVIVDYEHASFGARFWGQVRVLSGQLRVLRGKGAAGRETARIAGKAR